MALSYPLSYFSRAKCVRQHSLNWYGKIIKMAMQAGFMPAFFIQEINAFLWVNILLTGQAVACQSGNFILINHKSYRYENFKTPIDNDDCLPGDMGLL